MTDSKCWWNPELAILQNVCTCLWYKP